MAIHFGQQIISISMSISVTLRQVQNEPKQHDAMLRCLGALTEKN